jgi:hypothetical protein
MSKNLRLVASLFLVLSLLCFTCVFAEYDWRTYGNGFTSLWNEQYGGATGRFNVAVNLTSSASVMSMPDSFHYQPLTTSFTLTNGSQIYLIIPNGNYIDIYDKNLNLVQEISSGTVASQLDTMDFFNKGDMNDIVGFFTSNATVISFRVFTYNYTTTSFNKSYELNFTVNASSSFAGVRHSGQNIYTVLNNLSTSNYSILFIQINQSSSSSQFLQSSQNAYTEPLAFTDIDSDGMTEYLTYGAGSFLVFRADGTKLLYRTGSIRASSMYKPDSSSSWKILSADATAMSTITLTSYKLDGSSYWAKTFSGVGGTGAIPIQAQIAITDDYDGDNLNDVYLVTFDSAFLTGYVDALRFYVLKGSTGNTLVSKNFDRNFGWGINIASFPLSLTLANLHNSNQRDFIFQASEGFFIYDISNDKVYLNKTPAGVVGYSCIPSDINSDGFQEVICSGTTGLWLYASNVTNQNPSVSVISYDPSTSVAVGTTVSALITASDSEGDSIIYGQKCYDSDNYTESYSSTRSCYYNAVGIYNFTIGVRDQYHSSPNTYSQIITVTTSGTVCGNGICEAGETSSNCPSDCPVASNTTTSSSTGGTTVPNQIVDVNDINKGWLPEVYYGMLGFLSNTITPFMILVFAILFVMIMLAIAFVIKRIGQKVGELSR